MTVRDAWTAQQPALARRGRGRGVSVWKVLAVAIGAGVVVYALKPSERTLHVPPQAPAQIPAPAPPPAAATATVECARCGR